MTTRRAFLATSLAAATASPAAHSEPNMHTGSPTDFDFLEGNWRVAHERLNGRLVGSSDWQRFNGPHLRSTLMNQERRDLLNAGAAALIAATAAGNASAETTPAPTPTAVPPGNPGEFNFLAGEWRIHHRRLRAPNDWDVFEGEATCFTILNGVGSVEELRVPSRDFIGMGLRLLDVNACVWSDFWVNGKSGVLAPPGQTGGFVDGVGTFGADDFDGDQPIKVRGIWDEITPTTCRWRQAISRDGGATWEENWIMHWTRA